MSNYVQAFECKTCKSLHRVDSDTYVSCMGSFVVGKKPTVNIGKLVGLEGSGEPHIYCRKFECLKFLISHIAPDATCVSGLGNLQDLFSKPGPIPNVTFKQDFHNLHTPDPVRRKDVIIGYDAQNQPILQSEMDRRG